MVVEAEKHTAEKLLTAMLLQTLWRSYMDTIQLLVYSDRSSLMLKRLCMLEELRASLTAAPSPAYLSSLASYAARFTSQGAARAYQYGLMTLQQSQWSPETHHMYPAEFQAAVKTLLMVRRRGADSEEAAGAGCVEDCGNVDSPDGHTDGHTGACCGKEDVKIQGAPEEGKTDGQTGSAVGWHSLDDMVRYFFSHVYAYTDINHNPENGPLAIEPFLIIILDHTALGCIVQQRQEWQSERLVRCIMLFTLYAATYSTHDA